MSKKNNKRTYHRPPSQKTIIQKPTRLSQCMIVKNEEKNIEKALSWAKGIAFEQIVVDTGSSDRTVEIAESMGAKVFHFEWINDFSAAKNFAIEQASGDWIAFLDADEYFPDEEVKKLVQTLKNVESNPVLRKVKSAIRCPIVNLDDNGKPFLVIRQDRIFRNDPELRYKGRIHEYLDLKEPFILAPELSIIHTGYTNSAYAETGKVVRNVDMIREELRRDPDNATLKCYLADSLRIAGDTQNLSEAEKLYSEALTSGQTILSTLKQNAYGYLIAHYFEDETRVEENTALCREAYTEFPENPDFCFYYGRKLHVSGDYIMAWEKLVECENLLKGSSVNIAGWIISHPVLMFYQMTITAEALGNISEVIRCATLALKEDKYQQGMITPYIAAFNRSGYETSASEIFELLSKLYDFDNLKDKLTVMQGAKSVGNVDLVQLILGTFTKEELSWLTGEAK